jgi:DNA-binding transcriptional LysR family regulator
MNLALDDILLFTRMAELGSLSAAARERNAPVSQVTRALKRLEATCGVQLLHRNTHGLNLTDEGDTFLSYAKRTLDNTAELAADIRGKQSQPSGWVRVSVSALLAQCVIAPSAMSLYQQFPELHLDIHADDRMADMAREGIDIALRTGKPHHDTLVARQIGSHSRTLYAAPAYLAQFGTPTHLADLAQHRLMASSASPALNRWELAGQHRSGDKEALQINGHTRTDNSALHLNLVLHGAGMALLNDLMVQPLVRDGQLVPLLQGVFSTERIPIYAVTLQTRQRLPKIRACIDYWAEWLRGMAV